MTEKSRSAQRRYTRMLGQIDGLMRGELERARLALALYQKRLDFWQKFHRANPLEVTVTGPAQAVVDDYMATLVSA